jgi:hypothetical protein
LALGGFCNAASGTTSGLEHGPDQHSGGHQLTTANRDFVPLKQAAPPRQKSFLIQCVGAWAKMSGAECARHGAQAAKIA